jgi:hypothetical protein
MNNDVKFGAPPRSNSPVSTKLRNRINILTQQQASTQTAYDLAKTRYNQAGGENALRRKDSYSKETVKPLKEALQTADRNLQFIRQEKRSTNQTLHARPAYKTGSQKWSLPDTPPGASTPTKDSFRSEKQSAINALNQNPNDSNLHSDWVGYLVNKLNSISGSSS